MRTYPFSMQGLSTAQINDMATYPAGDFITANQVRAIFPNLNIIKAKELAVAFNEVCPKYGLNKPDVFHEFVATCGEESRNFTVFSEIMGYTPQRMIDIWGKDDFPTLEFAQQYAMNPVKLANYIYANKLGNGNEASGDGFKMRGGGAIMLTGRDIWTRYASYKKTPLDVTINLVRNNLRSAIDSACWVFAIEKGLIDEAINDDFKLITKRIAGGYTNMAHRNELYLLAKKALPE